VFYQALKLNFFKYLFLIWRFLDKRKKIQVIYLLFLMIFSAFSEVLNLAIIVPFLKLLTDKDFLFENETTSLILIKLGILNTDNLFLVISFLLIFAILFSGSIRILNLYFLSKFSASIGNKISTTAYKKCLYQDYQYHKNINSSELISTITTRTNITVTACNYFLQFITSALSITFILVSLYIIDFQMALSTTVGLSLIYLFIITLSNKRLRINSKIVSSCTSQQYKELDEGLSSFKEIILESNQDQRSNLYNRIDFKMRSKTSQSFFINSFPRYAIEAISITFIITLSIYLDFIREENSSFIAYIGILALACQRILPYAQLIYQSWAYVRASSYEIEKALELANQNVETSLNFPIKRIDLKDKITLNELSFSYSNFPNKNILNKISLVISKGDNVAIIGKTGSGKSTFIDILMGLIKPTEGKIFINGIDIYNKKNKSKLYGWRKSIAHIPQNIFLSDTSILENIAYGIPKEEIDKKLVINSAKKALIHDFIVSLPNKYQTEVGEKGMRISGGQKQRIGIARALYKKSKIIILDEATSALDKETESKVMKSIHTIFKDKTIISISHKIPNFGEFNRILKFSEGKIYNLT